VADVEAGQLKTVAAMQLQNFLTYLIGQNNADKDSVIFVR